ncbi:Uncharacterised protein [Providencia rustigianii]|nr:Uncharacterised protein [Providencia rustigianii]
MSNARDMYTSIYNKLINQFNLLNQNYSKLLNVRVDFHYAPHQPVDINKAYQDMIYLYHIFKKNNDGVIGCQFVLEYTSIGDFIFMHFFLLMVKYIKSIIHFIFGLIIFGVSILEVQVIPSIVMMQGIINVLSWGILKVIMI